MSRFVNTLICLILSLMLTAGWLYAGQSASSTAPTSLAKGGTQAEIVPRAVFPVTTHAFGEVFEGVEVKYDFVVENQGGAPLVIKNIRPD